MKFLIVLVSTLCVAAIFAADLPKQAKGTSEHRKDTNDGEWDVDEDSSNGDDLDDESGWEENPPQEGPNDDRPPRHPHHHHRRPQPLCACECNCGSSEQEQHRRLPRPEWDSPPPFHMGPWDGPFHGPFHGPVGFPAPFFPAPNAPTRGFPGTVTPSGAGVDAFPIPQGFAAPATPPMSSSFPAPTPLKPDAPTLLPRAVSPVNSKPTAPQMLPIPSFPGVASIPAVNSFARPVGTKKVTSSLLPQ